MLHRRHLFGMVLSGIAGVGLGAHARTEQPTCRTARITGYVRTDFTGRTYDGTSIRTPEPICAASFNIPLGSRVWIEGLEGTFRVADRGRLGWSDWIDVACWSRAEAYDLTGERMICVYPPAETS